MTFKTNLAVTTMLATLAAGPRKGAEGKPSHMDRIATLIDASAQCDLVTDLRSGLAPAKVDANQWAVWALGNSAFLQSTSSTQQIIHANNGLSLLDARRHAANETGGMESIKSVVTEVGTYQVSGVGAAPLPFIKMVLGRAPLVANKNAASNDNHASSKKLDQYYTQSDVAKHFYGIFKRHIDPGKYLMVEPSAGTGSFFKLMPPGSLGYDIAPKYPGIVTADFLTVTIKTDRAIAILGNPPFGKNSSAAVRHFNHAARQASVIAFIVPRTFRKAFIENRLDRHFRLVCEYDVPANAFLFQSKPYNVPAVFQIWIRSQKIRASRPVKTTHPDFEFTTKDRADFAIQRVGARAGRVHHDFTKSPSSHYFIRGPVEHIMRQLDFLSVVGDVAGNPSLAKSEIVALYCKWIEEHGSV